MSNDIIQSFVSCCVVDILKKIILWKIYMFDKLFLNMMNAQDAKDKYMFYKDYSNTNTKYIAIKRKIP